MTDSTPIELLASLEEAQNKLVNAQAEAMEFCEPEILLMFLAEVSHGLGNQPILQKIESLNMLQEILEAFAQCGAAMGKDNANLVLHWIASNANNHEVVTSATQKIKLGNIFRSTQD